MTAQQNPRAVTTSFSKDELDVIYRSHRTNRVCQTITKIAKYGFTAWAVWFVADGVTSVAASFAGKVTAADVRAALSVSADVGAIGELLGLREVFEGLLALLAIGCFAYARAQKKRAQQTIEQLAPFRQLYEQLLDAKRTSSGLLPTGGTPPEADT